MEKNQDEIIVIVNEDNKFDENGVSLDPYNSTEVTVYVNGKRDDIRRIGGTQYRTLENIGKRFKGYVDSLGFYGICRNQS